jgi:hypothetical protein
MSDEALTVLSYGGGRQTIALALLVAYGHRLPRPDRVVIADTGREPQSTWDYLEKYVSPLLAGAGLTTEIASHRLATVDLYGLNGDLLIPAFTGTGKLPTFCSQEWKARVVQRHLRASGVGPDTTVTTWIGFGADEAERIRGNYGEGCWRKDYPLVALGLTTGDCLAIIQRQGWPEPPPSSCWMCPHRSNRQWRALRDGSPHEWASAVALDADIRQADERGALYLHRQRVPLAEADLDAPESPEVMRQCSLGLCMV